MTANDDTDVKTVKVIGKNFFNRHYTKSETNIGVTVEWDAENQEFVFNGTTTAAGDIKIVNPLKIDWIPGEKYAVSVRRVSGTAILAAGTNATTYGWGIFQDNAAKYTRGSTGNSAFLDNYNFTATAFALDANRQYIFYFQCWRPGTVFNDYRVKIQIEKGTTLTDWEAYREESTTLDDVTSLKLQKGFNTIVTVPTADIAIEYVADTKLYIDRLYSDVSGDDGYTPVKGKDYWTPEDKQEIIDEIIDEIDVTEEISALREELSYDAEKWGEATNTRVSENIIKSDEVTWQYGYLAVASGTCSKTDDENWRHTLDYIPASDVEALTIKNSIIGHNSVAMFAFYDKGKNYIAEYTQKLVKGNQTYNIPKNSNVAFVRFCVGNKTSSTATDVTFDTQEIYIARNVPVETPKENIDHIYEKLDKLDQQAALNNTATPLVGKIVFLAGDSRSSTDYDFYKTTLEAKCGCTALVQGASGRNVAYNASNEYFNRLINNPHDFSLWIVGGNDTGASGTIGTFSADSVNGKNGEAVVEETDITADYAGTKFIQAIDHMMRKYKALFYDFKKLDNFHIPKMIFCTDLPQQRSSATSAWSLKENWERKRNAIIECAEKNNVALLDLYKLCNFDMSFEPYWVSPTDKVNDNGLYFMDGLHPNKFGIDIITSLEVEEMKKYITVNAFEKVRVLEQDGLIMYCDGINNTENGHSDTATTWKDLTGNGNDLINVASTTTTTPASSVQGEWLENGIRVIANNNQFLRTTKTFDLGADRTIEMRVTLNADANMTLGFNGADRVKFRSASAAFWARVSLSDSSGTQDIRSLGATPYGSPVTVSITRSYDANTSKTTFMAYTNGIYKNSFTVDGNHRTSESAYLLFGSEQVDVTVHTVRMYNRALTADEVKENYKYDMQYFSE